MSASWPPASELLPQTATQSIPQSLHTAQKAARIPIHRRSTAVTKTQKEHQTPENNNERTGQSHKTLVEQQSDQHHRAGPTAADTPHGA